MKCTKNFRLTFSAQLIDNHIGYFIPYKNENDEYIDERYIDMQIIRENDGLLLDLCIKDHIINGNEKCIERQVYYDKDVSPDISLLFQVIYYGTDHVVENDIMWSIFEYITKNDPMGIVRTYIPRILELWPETKEDYDLSNDSKS